MSGYLLNERTPEDKAFTLNQAEMTGRTARETYHSYTDFKVADDQYRHCFEHATAFTNTLLTRVENEEPEIFQSRGIDRGAMHIKLIKNMCLNEGQMRARVMRETTARINEKRYLNDDIRRLSNDGNKFHPYL